MATRQFMECCTSYYEGTELKANHNNFDGDNFIKPAVLAITKVLN